MPHGVAAVRGSFWKIQLEQIGNRIREIINFLHGEGEVQSGDYTVPIKAGERTAIEEAGAPPTEPEPMTTEEKQEWVAMKEWITERIEEIQERLAAPPAPMPPVQAGQLPAPQEPGQELPAPPPVLQQVMESLQELLNTMEALEQEFGQPSAQTPPAVVDDDDDDDDGGGGGGTGPVDEEPEPGDEEPQPEPDLELISHTLQDDNIRTSFPVDGSIVLNFNRKVVVNANQILLRAGAEHIGIHVTLAADGMSMKISPRDRLPYGSVCNLTIQKGAIKDTDGNSLPETILTFATESFAGSTQDRIIASGHINIKPVYEWYYNWIYSHDEMEVPIYFARAVEVRWGEIFKAEDYISRVPMYVDDEEYLLEICAGHEPLQLERETPRIL